MRCTAAPSHHFPFRDGILQLVAPEQQDTINAISEAHDATCAALGWKSPDEAEFKSVPQTAIPGYAEDYWPRQAASTALLWRFLEAVRLEKGVPPVGLIGEAAVIGAGMGWLAYALDVAGYTTLALDARAGSLHGLGVFPIARYLRIQADLNRLPLAPAAFDWLIFPDGLTPLDETAGEAEQQAALDTALRALRPGGWVAVMNSLTPTPEDVAVVHTVFEEAGLILLQHSRQQGWRKRLLELRDRLARREDEVPPVLVGQKPA